MAHSTLKAPVFIWKSIGLHYTDLGSLCFLILNVGIQDAQIYKTI